MDKQNSQPFRNKLSKRIICTPSPAAKDTFFYVQEAANIKPDDSDCNQPQNLDSFLFAAVVSGKGELLIGGDSFSLNKGDCFMIDCHTPYRFKSSVKDPWELLWIYFNGSTSQQYYNYFISHSKNVFTPSSFDKISYAVMEILSLNELNDPNAEALTSQHIVELLTIALTANSSKQKYDSALKQKLSSVHNYINEHFAEDISLEMLSSEFYISKFYLTREYKRIFGMTIFQHIITARINYGKKLLRFSDKSVEEIAHMCGFNDQSYFARQFKKAENLTCFAYRKKWRD
ncbi:MAG: AraC family transcriptional regulator [Ruminococcus flavefaciens]|jgi:AraC-like DNA-binding protein|nr:AraC family transcriptional regulator [Ruminococcus flavefaciens]